MIVVEVILAAMVVLVVWAMCWLTYWDIRETCAEQLKDSVSLEPRYDDGWRSEGPIRESRPGTDRNPAVGVQVGDAEPYDWERETA